MKLKQILLAAGLSVTALAATIAIVGCELSSDVELSPSNESADLDNDQRIEPLTKAYCNGPNSNLTIHSSLDKIEAFAESLRVTPRTIGPAHCLAVAAFAKAHDWENRNCGDRGVKAAALWLRQCSETDWKEDSTLRDGNCNMLGRYDDDEDEVSEKLLKKILMNNYNDCIWSEKDLFDSANPEVIETAISILQAPH